MQEENTKDRVEDYYRLPDESVWSAQEEDLQKEDGIYGEETYVQELQLCQGWQPFYIFPLLYALSPYFVMLVYGLVAKLNEEMAGYCIFLPVVFGVLNIIVCVKFCKPENRIVLLNSAVLVKCALIPFFIMGGLVILVAGLLSFIPVPFMIFVGPTIAIMGLIMGWVLLAFGAPYTLAYLKLSVKAGIRAKFVSVIHGLLQFCFTVDVIDVMFLAIRERKWIKLFIGLIVVFILLIIIAIVGAADVIADITK